MAEELQVRRVALRGTRKNDERQYSLEPQSPAQGAIGENVGDCRATELNRLRIGGVESKTAADWLHVDSGRKLTI